MTLGNAVSALVRLIVWCRACQHQVEPDPACPGRSQKEMRLHALMIRVRSRR